MNDHLTPSQIEKYLTAISTEKTVDERIEAAGDLLARPLPYDARREIKSIYLDLTDARDLVQEGIAA